jgi:hypothetical protein
MQWSTPGRTEPAAAKAELAAGKMIETLAVLSAVSFLTTAIQLWSFASALTDAYLNGRDLVTMEGGDT